MARKNNFRVDGVNLGSHLWFETQEIHIDAENERARYRIILEGIGYMKIIYGKWQPIRYTEKGDRYIMNRSYGKQTRMHFKNFVRPGSAWLPTYKSPAD